MNEPNHRGGEETVPAATDLLAVSAAIAIAFDVLETETLKLEESPRLPSSEDE
ncbi:MAG: hypothetical protein M3O36_20730 [Myxococcota bacterium]|nr:hypothetical protein [Myxococcota bacterium]